MSCLLISSLLVALEVARLKLVNVVDDEVIDELARLDVGGSDE